MSGYRLLETDTNDISSLEGTLEAELLALVPEESRVAAEATLLLLLEIHAAAGEAQVR